MTTTTRAWMVAAALAVFGPAGVVACGARSDLELPGYLTTDRRDAGDGSTRGARPVPDATIDSGVGSASGSGSGSGAGGSSGSGSGSTGPADAGTASDAGDGGCDAGGASVSCLCAAVDPSSGPCTHNGLACSLPDASCVCTNACPPGSCCPMSCAQLGFPCGLAGDGCGGILKDCRVCPEGQTCGPQRTCEPSIDGGCAPRPCPASACGVIDDGCGGTIDCGGCYWSCGPGSGSGSGGGLGGNDAGPTASAVLFGGLGSARFSDTWVFRAGRWSQIPVVGPSARDSAVMAPLGGEVVLFGGEDGNGGLADTWTWNGASWTQLSVTGPGARWGAVMAPLAGKLVLFGGWSSTLGGLSDTWTWDGASWARINVAGPPAREGAVMAPLGNKLVLFGGFNSSPELSDTWTWDGTTWARLFVAGPSAREGAVMASLGGKLLLFGGWDGVTSFGDSWTWNGAAWTGNASAGPAPRPDAVMAPVASGLVLFGGYDASDPGPAKSFGDTWAWDGAVWTSVSVAGPPARFGAVMATQ